MTMRTESDVLQVRLNKVLSILWQMRSTNLSAGNRYREVSGPSEILWWDNLQLGPDMQSFVSGPAFPSSPRFSTDWMVPNREQLMLSSIYGRIHITPPWIVWKMNAWNQYNATCYLCCIPCVDCSAWRVLGYKTSYSVNLVITWLW